MTAGVVETSTHVAALTVAEGSKASIRKRACLGLLS
jgi:hypothetical protein